MKKKIVDNRRKSDTVITTTFLLNIIIFLLCSYAAYVMYVIDAKIDQNFKMVMSCQKEIFAVRERISSHLAWHQGKKRILHNKISED